MDKKKAKPLSNQYEKEEASVDHIKLHPFHFKKKRWTLRTYNIFISDEQLELEAVGERTAIDLIKHLNNSYAVGVRNGVEYENHISKVTR